DESAAWEPRGWQKIRDRVEGRTPATAPPPRRTDSASTRSRPAGASDARTREPGLGNAEEWLAAGGEGLAPPPPPGATAVQRVRVTYRKVGRARFISHLELIEVFTRALRRAGLPVAFSGGHHPQPRLRFSPGLPVGAESECEVIDVDLS